MDGEAKVAKRGGAEGQSVRETEVTPGGAEEMGGKQSSPRPHNFVNSILPSKWFATSSKLQDSWVKTAQMWQGCWAYGREVWLSSQMEQWLSL